MKFQLIEPHDRLKHECYFCRGVSKYRVRILNPWTGKDTVAHCCNICVLIFDHRFLDL